MVLFLSGIDCLERTTLNFRENKERQAFTWRTAYPASARLL